MNSLWQSVWDAQCCRCRRWRSVADAGAGAVLPMPALAQTTPVNDPIKQLQSEIRNVQKHYETEIRNIQKQHETEIRNLQRQLDDLKAVQAAPKPSLPPAQAALPPAAVTEAKRGGFLSSGIDLTVGGYIEAASIYRTRNETADISSNFNTAIPFPNSPNYHLSELRFSAHQTRLSLLGQGKVDPDTALAGYVETDFQSAPADSNSIESNSYTPRPRDRPLAAHDAATAQDLNPAPSSS